MFLFDSTGILFTARPWGCEDSWKKQPATIEEIWKEGIKGKERTSSGQNHTRESRNPPRNHAKAYNQAIIFSIIFSIFQFFFSNYISNRGKYLLFIYRWNEYFGAQGHDACKQRKPFGLLRKNTCSWKGIWNLASFFLGNGAGLGLNQTQQICDYIQI